MAVDGGRQAEQGLQQALDVGGFEEVLAPDHVGHALQGVVHRDGQMVGDAEVLAGQHDVAADLRAGSDLAGLAVGT